MKKNTIFRVLMILICLQLLQSCKKERLLNTFERNLPPVTDQIDLLRETSIGKPALLTSGTEYIIRNKYTQKVIDIKGGITTPGTQLWQGNIDLSDAQYFKLVPVGPESDSTFRIQSLLSGLFVSVKYELLTSDGSTGVNANDNYYITQDNAFPPNNSPVQVPTNVNSKNQYWKLVAVAKEENTFFIKSVRYPTKVLKPVIDAAKSALFITDYTTAIRKQWIFQPIPKKASELVISDFSYKNSSHRITGKITWKDNSGNEDFFKITVTREGGGTWTLANRPANGTGTASFNFTFGETESEAGKNKQHCFTITAGNKWGGESSKKVCKVATYVPPKPGSDTSPTPPTTPPTNGVSKLLVYNCHSEERNVRLWILEQDLTTGLITLTDIGDFPSQWSGGSCPGTAPPKQITLQTNHDYILYAIDGNCGGRNPFSVGSSCRKLTTDLIHGYAKGVELTVGVGL